MLYRHGDVLLRRLGDSPELADARARDEVVVAEGEVTGHAHRVRGERVELRDESDNSGDVLGKLRLYLPQGGTITHEEHGPIDLPPGMYEVRHQRTQTQAGVWERVRD